LVGQGFGWQLVKEELAAKHPEENT
jgi:hypothetical protein